MSAREDGRDIVQRLISEEWVIISLTFYLIGYWRNLKHVMMPHIRLNSAFINHSFSGVLPCIILTTSYTLVMTYLAFELLKWNQIYVHPLCYYGLRVGFLLFDIFEPVSLCLLLTFFTFSPVHAKFYAKLLYPILFIIYIAAVFYEYQGGPNAYVAGFTNQSVIIALLVLVLFNIGMTVVMNYTVRNKFIKLLKFYITARKHLYILCAEVKLTRWSESLLRVISVFNIRHLCLVLTTRLLGFSLSVLPEHLTSRLWPVYSLANLLHCIIIMIPVTQSTKATKLHDILFDHRSRHLFNIYVTQTGMGNQQLFFLTDAAAYQMKVATCTNISQLKDILIRLYYTWFVKTPVFPPEIYQSITETVISLLSLPYAENELSDYKRLFIRAMRDAEISISDYLSYTLVQKYQTSRLGFMEYVYNLFFCLSKPKTGYYMIELFMKSVFSLENTRTETKELVDTVIANPYTMMYISDIIKLYIPDHRVEYVPSGDISPPVEYKPHLFVKETQQQLLLLSQELLNTSSITESQKKMIKLYLEDIFMRKIQHRFFVRDQEHHMDAIHQYFSHLIGKRAIATLRNPLLSRYDDRSKKETMNVNTYLLDLRTSVTHIEQNINNAVDTFLSATFCAHDSMTDDMGPLSYSLVRDSFSGDDVLKQNKVSQGIKVRGKYLAYPTPQIKEKNYKIYDEFSANEKSFLKAILLSKSTISSLERFITAINEDVFSQHANCFFSQGSEDSRDLTTSVFFPTRVSKHLKGVSGSALGSYWTNMIVNGPSICDRSTGNTSTSKKHAQLVQPEKSSCVMRSNISNHKKLFRLLFSCIYYSELSHYKIPPQSLSDLCYRLTSNEASGAYYCSTRTILVLRQIFLFITTLQKGFQGLLSDAQILGILLAATCHSFNHATYSEDGIIASQQWLANIYSDRLPLMNYIAASGWILIRESGVLVNIPISVRRTIRLVYVNFLRSLCKKSLSKNYANLYAEIKRPVKKDAIYDLALRVCFMYGAVISCSDHLSNKSNSMYLSLLKHAEHRREEQILAYSLYTDESYLMRFTSYMDVLPPTEYAKSVHLLRPIISLIEEALMVIGEELKVPVEAWVSEISGINKDIHSVEKMWASTVLRK